MTDSAIPRIVIAGGGTAGWMAAAALARSLGKRFSVRLVESDEIGPVGVGEATIPMIRVYNQALDLDEDQLMRATQATFKLGIQFVNWGRRGEAYMHGFGPVGQPYGIGGFDKYWQKYRQAGHAAPLGEYTMTTSAALAGRFMRPLLDRPNSPLSHITYAFHLDALLLARFLRTYAEQHGVRRTEGRIRGATLRASDGHVEALVLDSGERIEGDLFIDCTGFAALLIGRELQVPYRNWNHWLPCDRALAVPSAGDANPLPYTRATALDAGWQWRIPLQHRTGNGHVYASAFISDDQARTAVLANLDGAPMDEHGRPAEPRLIRYTTGMRERIWERNVIAVGLASGFLEPLESTSIHLVQAAVAKILEFLPGRAPDARDRDEFNRLVRREFEDVRDFIILHYKLTQRDDTPFWRHCAGLAIPDSLARRIELFRSRGMIVREGLELFAEPSWLQVMVGQGLVPEASHALADTLDDAELAKYMNDVRDVIGRCVAAMPTHAEFIRQHCQAGATP